MNDGICRYRGILQPSAASNQSDTSQMASIYLSNNRESYRIKQFAKCGVCECFFLFFYLFIFFFRYDMIQNYLKTIGQFDAIMKL